MQRLPAALPHSPTPAQQRTIDPSAVAVSSPVFQVAHGAVLICLATMLSGIERFFAFWSTSLHYGFDAFAIIAVVTSFAGRRQWRSFLLTVAPGLLFVLTYLLWGLLVSPDESSLQSRTVSAMILAVLTMSTLSVGFHDRRTLRRFADVCCCVAIFTFVMMVYELGTPAFISEMAQAAGSITDYTGRPSGFWSNPNDCAVVLVACFIVSHWARSRLLAWMGRLTAIIGVYLSGSREALLLLLLAILTLTGWRLLHLDPTTRKRIHLRSLASSLALISALAGGLVVIAQIGGSDVLQNSLSRVLDFSQSQNSITYNPSRQYLLQLWWPIALENPWYGGGIYSFQGNGTLEVLGAHNLYLTVFGEDGLVMLALYLSVLGLAVWRAVTLVRGSLDRVLVGLLFGLWLFEGVVAHHQFSDPAFTILFAALFRLPEALQAPTPVPSALPAATATTVSAQSTPPSPRASRPGRLITTLPSGDVHAWSPITYIPS